ncbi:type VI secretion protein [Streptomyces sp. NPDC054887]
MRQHHTGQQGHHQQGERGIPDSLLVGLLAFLLGLTILAWLATGLAGLFAHGAWPEGVTFTRTPLALRHLMGAPQDIPAAWPDTPPGQLSGYGLFWGLLIGELMVLGVLTIFVLGVLARLKAQRETARAKARATRDAALTPEGPAPATPSPYESAPHGGASAHGPGTQGAATQGPVPYAPGPPGPGPYMPGTYATAGAPPGHEGHEPYEGHGPPESHGLYGATPHPAAGTAAGPVAAEHRRTAAPHAGPPPGTYADPARAAHGAGPSAGAGASPGLWPATHAGPPQPTAAGAGSAPLPETLGNSPQRAELPRAHAPQPAPLSAARTPRLLYGDPAARRPSAVQAVLDAEGPALVVTSDPAVWAETKDARAKLGPVLVYDPCHLCDTPARLHWSPTAGCDRPDVAAARAVALLAPIRPQARLDTAMADTAETLLSGWLHAAAVDGRPFRQVHRWAQGHSAHEPVRILRTHPKASGGAAGLLESALTAYPERRQIAQELTVRALAALSSVHIREACTPNRTDSVTLESFVAEGGTLYVVGEAIEDPKSRPGAMPLLTALTSSVVEHGRRMAARSSDGRLDPPMTFVLDDVAAVAPLPQLPELLSAGQDQGLPTLVLLRSQEQGRARWPDHALAP